MAENSALSGLENLFYHLDEFCKSDDSRAMQIVREQLRVTQADLVLFINGLDARNKDLARKLGQARKRGRKVRVERDALRRRINEAPRPTSWLHAESLVESVDRIALVKLDPSELDNSNGR